VETVGNHLFGDDDFSDSALLPETSLKEGREDDTQLHKADLDSSMVHIGVSPVKLKLLSDGSKLKYAERKVDEVKRGKNKSCSCFKASRRGTGI
jgi:hypothetical protein